VFAELFFEFEEIFFGTQEAKKSTITQKKRMRILVVDIISEAFLKRQVYKIYSAI
jgi:hypothetical protein